jgi:HAD superfamily hydrolase (TIGR01549 family)
MTQTKHPPENPGRFTKWIFFDLGWTLVDETDAHRARLAETSAMLNGFGKLYSVDHLITMCEEAATSFAPSPFHGMLMHLGLSEDQLAAIKGSVRYAKENEKPYPGVSELITTLATRFKLGVIANQSKGTEMRLAQWGLRDQFSLVFASAELGLSKPDPEIFAGALLQAQCQPEDAFMVGDRLDNDIGPAKSQGWNTVRVLQGFSRFQKARNSHEEPDYTFGQIRELSTNKAFLDYMINRA